MKPVAIISILLIVLILAGCSSIPTMNKEKPTIYAFINPTDTEYWQQVAWGLEGSASAGNVEMNINEINIIDDYENSMDLIKKSIRKSTDAIIIRPFESEELHKLLKKAEKKGIPILYIDEPVNYDIPGTYIYSDNEKASIRAGDVLANLLDGDGKVVMLNIASENPKSIEREKGFKKAILEFPGMKLVNAFDCNSSRDITKKTMADILAAHPDIRGIFVACPETAAGAVSALTALNKINDIKIVAFDHTSETMDYIYAGFISAAVGQNPYQLGYTAVETALQIIAGKTVPEQIDVGYDFAGQETIDNVEGESTLQN